MATERIQIVVSERGSRTVRRSLHGIGESARGAEGAVSLLRRTLGGLAVGFGAASIVRTLASFGQEMSTVRAITGATQTQFEELNAVAKELGATTRFSASQAAEGMGFLARAGFNVDAVLESTESTLRLAQAGALDLGSAADIASNILTGFRLEAGQAARVVDVLALAANSSNTNVQQLGEGMKFVAPVAAGLGVALEEATAAVGALSDAGLQASLAGTGLRRVLAELESPANKTKRILSELGVRAEDVRVSQVGLTQALKTLRDAGVDTGRALEIFGDRGGPAFEVLSSSIPKVERMTDALQNAEGTAERVSKIMDDNLNGALLAVKSAAEALIIAFGDLGGNNALTALFRGLATVLRETANNLDLVGDAILALGLGALGLALGRTIIAFEAFVAQSVALQLSLGATSTAAAATGTALVTLQRALYGLRAALLANPLTALAVVLTGIVASMIAFRDETDETAATIRELDKDVASLKQAMDEAGGSIEDVTEDLDNLSRSAVLTRQGILDDAFSSTLQELTAETGQLVAAMREMTGASVEQQREIAKLAAEAIKGETSFIEFRAAVDEIGAGDEVLRPFVNEVIRMIDEARNAEDAIERNEAVLRVLSGTASAADRALLGLANSANQVAAASRNASTAISELSQFIPRLAKAAEVQGELAKAQAIFEQGQEDIRAEVSSGFLTLDGAAARMRELSGTYNEAVSEIDGTADALRDANEELDRQTATAALASKTGLERSIAVETARYKELRNALVEAGAGTDALALAEQNYQKIIAGLKATASTPSGTAETPKEDEFDRSAILSRELQLLDKEAQALRLIGDERAVLQQQLRVEEQIRNDLRSSNDELTEAQLNDLSKLTEAEAKAIDTATRRNLELQRQAQLLEEIQGPQRSLSEELDALNQLFEKGLITLKEYNQQLEILAQKQLEIDDSFSAGFTKAIDDAIKTTKEFGQAVGGIVVNGVERAANALVEFARTGKINIRALVADVLAQLAKLAAQQALLSALGAAVGAPSGGSASGFSKALSSLLGFENGGQFRVGGSGGPDSQLVAFKASPNERVKVETPEQQKSSDGQQAPPPAPNQFKIVNVLDPSLVGDFLQTAEGERLVINTVRRSGVLEN